MTKVFSILKEHKLSSSDVIGYLWTIGVQNPSLNTRIDSRIEQLILNHFFGKTIPLASTNKDFNIENPQLITVFTKNVFNESVQKVTHPKYKEISSHFTDEQAKLICLKMSNKHIRHFAKLFLTDAIDIDKITLKYQIHFLANKAIEFYGGKILTFIYELKNWTAGTTDVEVLKMNPKSVYNLYTNFPKLQVHSYENNKSYTITFTRAYQRYGASYYPLRITDNYTHESARVSIKGQLIDNFENFIPEVAIFKETIGDSIMLYSGYDVEYCDICGRKLEDLISIKYGRGPTCRNNYGIP